MASKGNTTAEVYLEMDIVDAIVALQTSLGDKKKYKVMRERLAAILENTSMAVGMVMNQSIRVAKDIVKETDIATIKRLIDTLDLTTGDDLMVMTRIENNEIVNAKAYKPVITEILEIHRTFTYQKTPAKVKEAFAKVITTSRSSGIVPKPIKESCSRIMGRVFQAMWCLQAIKSRTTEQEDGATPESWYTKRTKERKRKKEEKKNSVKKGHIYSYPEEQNVMEEKVFRVFREHPKVINDEDNELLLMDPCAAARNVTERLLDRADKDMEIPLCVYMALFDLGMIEASVEWMRRISIVIAGRYDAIVKFTTKGKNNGGDCSQ